MKTQEKLWYEVIIEYWAQITLLVTIIGFFIGKFIELTNKKKEIQFFRLHENKILEIKSFYKSYQALRNALQRFYNQTMYGKHSKEIFDNLIKDIADKFIDFDYNSMTIKLFIDKEDLETVDQIAITLSTIKTQLDIWHINAQPHNSTNIPDNLEKVRIALEETLSDLIKDIENNLRKSFNPK